MAGSIVTIAVIWSLLQTIGLFGHQNNIGAFNLPFSLDNYFYKNKGLSLLEPGQPLVVDTGSFRTPHTLPIENANLEAAVKYATGVLSRTERIEANLVSAGISPAIGSPEQTYFFHHEPSPEVGDKASQAVIAIGASAHLSQVHCLKFGLNALECGRFLSTIRLDSTPLGNSCIADQKIDCIADQKYRSLDGSCNNLQYPKWGSAFTAYRRLLHPEYADGIQMPRKEKGLYALPNPRTVSVALTTGSDKTDVSRSLALMEWSQFVFHDVTYTPVRKMIWTGKAISCCTDNGKKPSPRFIHPDCDAITISEQDPFYGKYGVNCLNYVRSLTVIKSDCTFGPAEQMNQVSHFLDGSTVYGSTLVRSSEIRAFEEGLLRVSVRNNKKYLPVAETESFAPCNSENCYLSGDYRVNAEPQVAVMHTLWIREHNRIARRLAKINPEWSDETLYQEARRIVIAEIQHITYKEWLPLIIGKRYARTVGFEVSSDHSKKPYNPYSDPAISNEVGSAALHFFQSLKQSNLKLTDSDRNMNDSIRLSNYFYKPRFIETNDVFDDLIRGLATQSAQKMDLHIISDLTQQQYKTTGDIGLDQMSLDIQRGRDHGLPGYNEFRKHCGLRGAKSFDDFLDNIPVDTIKKFRSLYKRPDDVDLLIGGMAERSADDALLGPTLRCLISIEFFNSRATDRFFYDSVYQPQPFTIDQLKTLKNVTLARIFCDNGNNISKMQPNVFLKPQKGNELKSCTDFEAIPSIDLFAWVEKAKAYR